MPDVTTPGAADFDEWYSSMAASPRRDEIVQRVLGLPPELHSTSLLGWAAIAEVTAALDLQTDRILLDLACGRGGYGLEIARRTGALLIGVDFSKVAIEQAKRQAEAFGLAHRAEFRVGELTATGLDDASVDAIVCVDAIQFAEPVVAGLAECRRVLAPGGRLVLTSWETSGDDESLPQRLRDLDLSSDLAAAGFVSIWVAYKPGWGAVERELWQEAIALDAGDDAALQQMQDEAKQTMTYFAALRRAFAIAEAPA
jgi:SAM-dependent methyltransferase